MKKREREMASAKRVAGQLRAPNLYEG